MNRLIKQNMLILSFVLLGLMTVCFSGVLCVEAHDNNILTLTVEPGDVPIPIDEIVSGFFSPRDISGGEVVVTLTSSTSEPNKSDPDTWYIWVKANNNSLVGPDNIPVSRLYYSVNNSGNFTPLTNQWVRIAVHTGTKHDYPPIKDVVRFRLRIDGNDTFTAGVYNIQVDYNISHDPYSPQL